jgi:hypothetical protein
MEINDLKTAESHEEGSQCFLLSADGKVSDAYVIVQGPDSPAFRLAKRTQRNKLITLRQQGEDLESYDFLPLDVDMAVDLIKDWGGITSDGKPVKYSKKQCRDLLSQSPVNVDRILDYCGERVNFTKG